MDQLREREREHEWRWDVSERGRKNDDERRSDVGDAQAVEMPRTAAARATPRANGGLKSVAPLVRVDVAVAAVPVAVPGMTLVIGYADPSGLISNSWDSA